MSPSSRAVIFDLDNTLYPQRRFMRSGFAAVARQCAEECGLDWRRVYRILLRASRNGACGLEFQAAIGVFDLPWPRLQDYLATFRGHEPRLRLPEVSRRVLEYLRLKGWKTAVLTNGRPDVQERKVAALGLEPLVDTVVYAAEHGIGTGKPDATPFLETVWRLGVCVDRCVMIGDDERADIRAASALGMPSVLARIWVPDTGLPTAADDTVTSLADVPHVARRLLEISKTHAA
ncbi:MAG TPA: HAD-IA family hydrolase [Vicinamibacterales bacterium]|nr:HAD-IA family hydrolase [Vicinamibacterales bacterium]